MEEDEEDYSDDAGACARGTEREREGKAFLPVCFDSVAVYVDND